MVKSKSKYIWEGWESSGREDWVFSVKRPCELIGVHAKLIDKALKDGEKVEYCIYAPRISSTSTPFGFKSGESSCGFCAADNRFIVTKNRHIKDIEPSLTSIDFKDILYFNIGSALLLSWISITYVQDGKLKCMPILFGSTGKHHFAKALRVFKKYNIAINTDDSRLDSFSPSAFIHRIKDKIHRNYLKTLLSEQEKCILTFSCQYLWERVSNRRGLFRRNNRITFLTNKATVLLTNKALLIARDELKVSIDSGIDIFNISLDKIKHIAVFEENTDGENIYKLKINFIKGVNPDTLDISLADMDEETGIFLNDIPSLLKLKSC